MDESALCRLAATLLLVASGRVLQGQSAERSRIVGVRASEWMLTDRYALSSGYALPHVSNAGFGESNPGLNAHLVYVKLAVARCGARP